MTVSIKECTACVYNGVCEGRKGDSTIIDCCIPEAQLRRLQRKALTADAFITVTHDYIRSWKAKSTYWSSLL